MGSIFHLQENKTTAATEIIAGTTTFLASMYIIVVNPDILSQAGLPFSGVLTATVLVSAFSSIMMGLYANNPIVLAPGMGLNVFFTFSVIIGMKVPWPTALGAVFWSGVVFLLLSVFNIRTYIVQAIPKQIRFGVAAGIGLFITFIGLTRSGFIINNPDTLIARGMLDSTVLTFLAGLAVSAVLISFRIKGALVIGIVLSTLLAWPIGRWYGDEILVIWKGLAAAPDFSLLFKLDLWGSLKLAAFPVVFAFLFTDMFDSLSTFVGVAEAGDLKDKNGEPRNIKESLIVDGFSTFISGLLGTSSGTSYIESAAGIEEGGRTGLTAVTAGMLFLPFMFLSPLLSIIPKLATAPALVLVGVFMMRPAKQINWHNFDEALPAFLAMVLIPFTNSITQGIIWAFLSWTIIKVFKRQWQDLSLTLIIIDFCCILALIV